MQVTSMILLLSLMNGQFITIKDQKTDIILWTTTADNEHSPIKNANPFFSAETLYLIAEWTPIGQAVCEGDLDHNQKKEIINSRWNDSARVYECMANDSFQKVYSYPCPKVLRPNQYNTSLKAIGDVDHDNKNEMIFTSGTSGIPREIVFVEAKDSLTMPDTIVLRLLEDSIGVNHMKIDDLDKDGKLECIGTTQGTHILMLAIWENVANDSYQMVWSTNFGQSYRPSGEFSKGYDYDGDGFLELVATNAGAPSHVYVIENRGDNQYTVTWDQAFPSDNAFWACTGSDLDNDSKGDFLVLGGRGKGPATWTCLMYEAVANDSFAPVWRYDVPSGIINGGLATGDINGDGHNELLVQVPSNSFLFRGVADDSLECVWQNDLTVIGQGEHRIITHDLDNDQKGEIAFYTNTPSQRTVVFEKSGPVHIAENSLVRLPKAPFKVYPNPFKTKINIEFNSSINFPSELNIFDIQGRLVDRIILNKQQSILDLKGLAPGVYFVQYGKKHVRMLVKAK